jgi:hypothetical protein
MPHRIFSLETVTTRFDPVEAEVSIAVAPEEPGEGLTLRGRLNGPKSPYANTVEIAYYLKPLPAEGDLLRARVIIPEANLWRPKTPFLYEGPIELWQGETCLDRQQVVHGLRHVRLTRHGLRLNGEAFRLKGVLAAELSDPTAERFRAAGINLIVAPVTFDNAELWRRTERLGFFVLGQLDGKAEEILWHAEEHLTRRVSALGWLLPQSLTREPQHWHNAMLHLQGGRRDVLFGVKLEELPLGVLPGHVSFLVCEARFLPDLEPASIPRLLLARRGEAADLTREEKDSPEILGKVQRELPD